MQGEFDIGARHFLRFIAMTPSIQKNATDKVYSVTRSRSGRGSGNGSDRRSGMPGESDIQASMGAIKSKYFRGSEQGYVATADYKKIPKDQQHAVYLLCAEQDVNRRPSAGVGTSKEYSNLKSQISALSKKMYDLLTMEEPYSDEDFDKKNKARFGGNNSNSALGLQWYW